ncbi:MAG TPA: SIS domain-containing protein [Caldithrix abyssi]|uniref:Phosphoheptose isomerase n=1 Tax=Caldithrix abyssi TaxID=187145 RepID=A0A7V5PNR1_CALAY|nr:SIS domain-containing protein [Caldithrix abyssi]
MHTLSEAITSHLRQSISVKEKTLQTCTQDIRIAIEWIVSAFRNQRKLLICGNGGSAADAQHIAAEFVVRLTHNLSRPALPAIALTTDSSILSAGGNDIGFVHVFSRQIEALGQTDDLLLAISTSGNSPNILEALATARNQHMKSIALLGNDGGKAKSMADLSIVVPSDSTQHIQETHITIGHILCEQVERILFVGD